MKIEDKFIRYIKIDTQSAEDESSTPSTKKQFDLARLLLEELHAMGITNAYLTDECLVYAHIDGESNKDPIGLIAHMDTALEIIGGNFEPRRINNYDGSDIVLSPKYTLSPKQFPSLNYNLGHDLLVTDGEHLLGGDDKAGVAIIMALAEFYMTHKEVKHAPLRICFTPDEEVGRGPENFSVEKMGAKIAYTVDGGKWDVISYENFNAYSVHVNIKGVSIHPGSAYGIMVNAAQVASEFANMLPKDKIPAKTKGREGFNHLVGISGEVDNADLYYIVRNHDDNLAKEQIKSFYSIKEELEKIYPTAQITVEVKESYKNMRNYFDKDDYAVRRIVEAFQKSKGITPEAEPIRGGTDGATITYMGLPCPNIGNGDYNCHGRYEYVDINEMYMMFDVLRTLLED